MKYCGNYLNCILFMTLKCGILSFVKVNIDGSVLKKDKLSFLSMYIFFSFWGSERRQKPTIPHLNHQATNLVFPKFFVGPKSRKNLFWTNKKFVFFFNCPNWEKFMEKLGETRFGFGGLMPRTRHWLQFPNSKKNSYVETIWGNMVCKFLLISTNP